MSKNVITLPSGYSFEYSKAIPFKNNAKIWLSYCSVYVLKAILLACMSYLIYNDTFSQTFNQFFLKTKTIFD